MSHALAKITAMIVFSNQRLGPSAELFVSNEVATAMLLDTANAARPAATARWERELVEWLVRCAGSNVDHLDVAEIAWTPDHFEVQRQFLVNAIDSAATQSSHATALQRWRGFVAAHPRGCVQVGRRWKSI